MNAFKDFDYFFADTHTHFVLLFHKSIEDSVERSALKVPDKLFSFEEATSLIGYEWNRNCKESETPCCISFLLTALHSICIRNSNAVLWFKLQTTSELVAFRFIRMWTRNAISMRSIRTELRDYSMLDVNATMMEAKMRRAKNAIGKE